MWPFINKVFDTPNGGWALLACFLAVVMAIEHIGVAIAKGVKSPKKED